MSRPHFPSFEVAKLDTGSCVNEHLSMSIIALTEAHAIRVTRVELGAVRSNIRVHVVKVRQSHIVAINQLATRGPDVCLDRELALVGDLLFVEGTASVMVAVLG